ncbi:MAG: nuclear transport factor 2 family protein [Novosphingobium sp.]|nr:nuclear transport factor 2 family protein [Novosphingobium sp.]
MNTLSPRDDQAVIAVGLRYARGIDQRDRATFLSCFAEDGSWGVAGTRPACGHDELAKTLEHGMRLFSRTQHVTTNFEVAVDGDRATMRSYYVATHVWIRPLDNPLFVMGGVYDDRLVDGPRGWRFAERVLTNVWTTGNPAAIAEAGMGFLLDPAQLEQL